ncbi:hypothetical protein M2283_010062 [Streptomyces pseudovenezuelae]|uniref:Uncharacterized protein n=1 Tax=Streptomyces pseudovenezuelae TaxID=67350 RepID=A0ABT6M2D3_9ACTN|nr:hypothetical protein [Streptomyces pseudovenezuelae]
MSRWATSALGKRLTALMITAGLAFGAVGCSGDGTQQDRALAAAPEDQLARTGSPLAELQGQNHLSLTITSAERDPAGYLTVRGDLKNDGSQVAVVPAELRGNELKVLRAGPSLAGATVVDFAQNKRYYVLRDTDGRPLTTTGLSTSRPARRSACSGSSQCLRRARTRSDSNCRCSTPQTSRSVTEASALMATVRSRIAAPLLALAIAGSTWGGSSPGEVFTLSGSCTAVSGGHALFAAGSNSQGLALCPGARLALLPRFSLSVHSPSVLTGWSRTRRARSTARTWAHRLTFDVQAEVLFAKGSARLSSSARFRSASSSRRWSCRRA